MGTKCSETKPDGTPCKAWAMPKTDPPLCSAHGGRKGGAPKGNQNARSHGGYAGATEPSTSLDRELEILTQQILDLESFIRTHRDDLTPDQYIRLHALLGTLCSRKGRLLRDRHFLSGEDASELSRMFEEAARMLTREKGWHE